MFRKRLALISLLAAFGLSNGLVAVRPFDVRSCVADDSLADRRQRLEQMSEQELAELRRKKERFDLLPAAEQERLRKLHADLSTDPNCEHLKKLLASYSAWLQTLTAAERAELLRLPPEQRLQQIRNLQKDQQKDEADRLGLPSVTISVDDARVVVEWIEAYALRHREEILRQMPRLAERLAQLNDPKRQAGMLVFSLNQMRAEGQPLPPLAPDELGSLQEKLSDASRQQLQAAGSEKDKVDLILKWCRAAFFRQFEPTREELEKFYRESLSSDDREWLDAMPRQRFQQTLRSLYFRDRATAEGQRGFPGGRIRGGGPPGAAGQPPGQPPGLPFPGRRPLDGEKPPFERLNERLNDRVPPPKPPEKPAEKPPERPSEKPSEKQGD